MTDIPDDETWAMRPRFKLRRVGMDGPLFLAIDPLDDALPILTEGFVCLELREGVSREDAMALIDQLTDMVAFVTYTGDQPAWNPAPGRDDRAGQKPAAPDCPDCQHIIGT